MAQPPQPPQPRLSHDDTFRHLLQQVEVIRDLVSGYLPALEGYRDLYR